MIVEYIRYRIPGEGGPEFEAAYAKAAAVLDRSPYCVDYELTRRTEEQTGPAAVEPDGAEHYVLRIRWTSSADHLGGFRQGPDFRAFFAAIRPYLTDIEEMRHYALTTVVGTGAAPG
ncbi:Quinol monooxygenase YgiN [Friedmanniella luteola]|uniref:Quinol monooxygenase YgiN n=1 Tax=Friedmanniella luteola TaxID=546871 RepID=A0A1H2A6L7_9ACTN|nr:antibiotic biosynthesis monooxygenase [Friedmanniella luteola]SDT41422.1 Quinol monooxygenase YgiN [Friedmanniella luteola]